MNEVVDPRLEEIISCLYRVASKAIIIVDGRLLTVQEEKGWYGLPGGGVEHGQDIRESLVREIEEELGHSLKISLISEQPILVSNMGVFDGIPRVTLCYGVTSKETEFPLPSELEHAWVDAKELRDLWLAPNIEPFRDQLLAFIK